MAQIMCLRRAAELGARGRRVGQGCLKGSTNKIVYLRTASVVYWPEFLTTNPDFLPDFLRSNGSGTEYN
jgi:hypothetical protein